VFYYNIIYINKCEQSTNNTNIFTNTSYVYECVRAFYGLTLCTWNGKNYTIKGY